MCLFGCWMTSCWIIVMKFPVAIFAASRSFSPYEKQFHYVVFGCDPMCKNFFPFVDKSVRHFTLMDDIWRQKIQCWANVQDFKMWNEGVGVECEKTLKLLWICLLFISYTLRMLHLLIILWIQIYVMCFLSLYLFKCLSSNHFWFIGVCWFISIVKV